jgi:hypothetical protein
MDARHHGMREPQRASAHGRILDINKRTGGAVVDISRSCPIELPGSASCSQESDNLTWRPSNAPDNGSTPSSL